VRFMLAPILLEKAFILMVVYKKEKSLFLTVNLTPTPYGK